MAPEIEDASDSFTERVVLTVCDYQVFLYMALVLESMLLFLAVLAALFADLDPATATVLAFSLGLLGLLLVVTVAGIVVCQRRRR